MQILITIAEHLQHIPPQIATLLLATMPVGELRGALPVALTIYNMSLPQAMFWSILGNILPVYLLLTFFEVISTFLRKRSAYMDRLFCKLIDRTRCKLEKNVEKYGVYALTMFVAVPLPVTGAWTGSLAAFVFGLEKKRAFLAILAGVCISSIIVATVTLGGIVAFRTLFAS